MAWRKPIEKSDSRLVRISESLVEMFADENSTVTMEWGEPVEYVITDVYGKNYMEPVFEPRMTRHMNDINEDNDPQS